MMAHPSSPSPSFELGVLQVGRGSTQHSTVILMKKTSPFTSFFFFSTMEVLLTWNDLRVRISPYRMMTAYIKGTARVVNRVPTLQLGQVR